jgi:UDP-N-acetylmuramyl pentapeptide synthase
VAVEGLHVDGHVFINDAIKRGAAALAVHRAGCSRRGPASPRWRPSSTEGPPEG